jgi:hypothetical protein
LAAKANGGIRNCLNTLWGKIYIIFLPEIESEFLRRAVGSRLTVVTVIWLFVIPNKDINAK